MLDLLQIVTVVLAAVALAPALAHALELPGKMRLAKDAYFAVQTIYYPGFTIAFASAGARASQDWKDLRDRWEYSHVVRASLAAVSFIALVHRHFLARKRP